MLRKIVILLLLSLPTSAVFADEADKIASKKVAASTQAVVKKLPAQIAELNGRNDEPLQISQLEPKLADAWLISLALLGFVMLSNRSAV
jgi:hypothetical protein